MFSHNNVSYFIRDKEGLKTFIPESKSKAYIILGIGTWRDFLLFGGNMGDRAHWFRTWKLNRSIVKR